MDEVETIVQKITGCPSAFDQIEHERKASPNFSFMISMAKILKKYPELQDEKTHPEELMPLMKRFNNVFQNLIAASAKIMKYANDPAVQ